MKLFQNLNIEWLPGFYRNRFVIHRNCVVSFWVENDGFSVIRARGNVVMQIWFLDANLDLHG